MLHVTNTSQWQPSKEKWPGSFGFEESLHSFRRECYAPASLQVRRTSADPFRFPGPERVSDSDAAGSDDDESHDDPASSGQPGHIARFDVTSWITVSPQVDMR
jgi:hypothetical protein